MKYLIFLIIAVFSHSLTIEAKYEARYGIFGVVAKATGYFEKNSSDYIIKTYSKTTKFINFQNYHISKGKVINNILIPLIYKNIIIRGDKRYDLVYKFDYKNRVITKLKYKNHKLIKTSKLDFFANNDILSLYFNLPKIMKTSKATFKAIGGEKHTGRIDIEILKKGKITKLKANLYNKIFAGDKGILYLDINSSNWVTIKGVVKNVLKIGDLKGELVDFKSSP